ncbi:MAG: ABC transporter ATP-binding protein [Firmicutes bacterium]|nr:ABC transporter ATP-binding protein [Bacillota bacterium]
MATLKVENLFKHYRNAKYISARNISFDVKEGEIFGFLGINGAGKSTTIKCITGIIPFTSGCIQVCGHDIVTNPYNAKKNFGFVPDNHAVYDKLTGVEYINYLADLYQVSSEQRKENFDMLVDKFNMRNSVNNQISSYSHGMKQKISIIGALIHSPKLWILDEPMVGLDPQSIFEVKEYMKEYAAAGNSVFFSSHNLDTVERLCDRAVIVHGGRVIRDIDLKEYRKTGKDLEKEFIELTKAATATQNQMRQELGQKEDLLAKEYGKGKANKMIIKQIKDELDNEIGQTIPRKEEGDDEQD